ncbi:MAG: Crp/Fnr family transcriptional regulator [Sphaerochaeta sp.]|jgi:CRP-like cAMP-binding protein|uniref:Crp/Fnr family transcriptional regulator n=1 Tax=Sphaerochaeta sp. TaxID=1972642 RepID=UPI002FCA67D1
MDTDDILKRSVLFNRVESQDLPHLLSCLKSRKTDFPKDYTIIDEGDYTDELGIVLLGSANIVRFDFWGNRTVVTNLEVGDSFAETIACTQVKSEVAVITTEPTTILFLNIHQVITTCQKGCVFHQSLIENLVKLLSHKNMELLKKINHITKRSTREKLLSYLSEEAKKRGSRTFTIPFDRQQLADYLCVERSAMSSELSRMRTEGLLEYHKSTFVLHQES